eukprot:jgi/Astpho2/8775/Aster-05331
MQSNSLACSSSLHFHRVIVLQFATLNKGIAGFYDESSALWERMWGEHMHHGYYPQGAPPKSNAQAQIDMIEETLRCASLEASCAVLCHDYKCPLPPPDDLVPASQLLVQNPASMVDVGCGIGGSSRHIARKFGCTAKGITLSPVQAARGNELAQAQGLGDRVSFQVADALHQPFEGGQFDLVWSMESGEHMPDKAQFVGELARVCKPGGRIIVVTWCHRNLGPEEQALQADEQALLNQICKAYYLPQWCSINDYERLMEAKGLQDIRTADWSEEVAPFWGAVIRSALSVEGFKGLFTAGLKTIKGALVMPLMSRGFKKGVVKFNLITAQKPLE